MISGRSSGDLSDLPTDVVLDIVSRLEMLDFVRFSATSNSYRSLCSTTNRWPKNHQMPWLMLSSRSRPEFRFFYDLSDKKTYKFHLPQIAGHHTIGSSERFLITVDRFADLHALNPLTGAELFPLPPTITQPGPEGLVEVLRDSAGEITHYVRESWDGRREELDLLYMSHFYRKAIVSPSLDMMVVIQNSCLDDLAFARAGDTSWTSLSDRSWYVGYVCDMIFHKGRLYAINVSGPLYIFDLNNHLEPPIKIESFDENSGTFQRFLIESPDGNDLYFLVKVLDDDGIPRITKSFRVGKLDKINQQWTIVKSIGEVAIFVGFNYSMAYSTLEFPHLKKNTIYFTYDDTFMYLGLPESKVYEENGDSGLFNLEDGSIELFTPVDELQRNWPPPVWFNPVLRR